MGPRPRPPPVELLDLAHLPLGATLRGRDRTVRVPSGGDDPPRAHVEHVGVVDVAASGGLPRERREVQAHRRPAI